MGSTTIRRSRTRKGGESEMDTVWVINPSSGTLLSLKETILDFIVRLNDNGLVAQTVRAAAS